MGRLDVMQEDLVVKITDFGFTVNQAKVYLSIVQSGKTRVGKISKNTQLHRQDIYKLLPKLEKMGLITRTIDKPFMIEALPVEKALRSIITKEKNHSEQRFARLESHLKEVAQAIQQQPEVNDEASFMLLTTDEAMENRSDLTFKRRPKIFLIVSTTENLKSTAGKFYREFLQIIANNKAKIHLIIAGSEDPDEIRRAVEKITPNNGVFKVRIIEKCPSKDYQVVDNKEVWIATQQKTQAGYPVVLWTNDSNVVQSYLENFNEAWNSPKAAKILENKKPKEMPMLTRTRGLMPKPICT